MNIDVNKLFNLIGRVNIIDIRSREKYNTSHIETSINIPFDVLMSNPDKYLEKGKTYYIYCQRGITSQKIMPILNLKGYKVINILGGYESWLLK